MDNQENMHPIIEAIKDLMVEAAQRGVGDQRHVFFTIVNISATAATLATAGPTLYLASTTLAAHSTRHMILRLDNAGENTMRIYG